ncbi:MAG: septum formation initiator family protein [Desulfuromonadales bacterium]|jgi:cell division protein FtsB|nr:septum formation initiator family protein [Desulfuromonadales bacterium]
MAEKSVQAGRSGMGRMALWPLTLIALVMGFALFGDRGVIHLAQLSNQKTALLAEMDSVKQQNSALREEIDALRSDRRYIERVARTELGMVREDELVFQFASRPGSGKPSSSAGSR